MLGSFVCLVSFLAQERRYMVFALRNYLCGSNGYDIYIVVRNRWIFLVWLQEGNFACLSIVVSCPLWLYANGLKDGYSAFMEMRWML